ncbi:hypothetical protein L1049_021861 [Liquidambar formosana]|uniref:Trehalase n=1 Tax=Liquidambar formosana TaxID=63359 RepID=A0AAP0RBI0_LIQFO
MTFTEPSSPCRGDSPSVKPTTPLITFLERIQETARQTFGDSSFDPKFYLDFSLKLDLLTTGGCFQQLARPADFVPEPDGFLSEVENLEVRSWALEVHSLWKNLSRKVSGRVHKRPELHTLLPLPESVVVPGSRFREVYYWDSYWRSATTPVKDSRVYRVGYRGLLASKMYETAKGIVTNLISLLDEYGYVLNGARAYYTNRSQPPLLSSMIHDLYDRTGDVEFVRKSLPALVKEHSFWNSGIHKVIIKDAQGCDHTLKSDKQSASKFLNDSDRENFYRELASAAESGWDFSTRWMRNTSDLTTLATTSILPVDLNAFLLKMELDIAFLAKVTFENSMAERFLEASQARKKAINAVLWNAKMGQWLDYWLNNTTTCEEEAQTWECQNQNQNVFASNFIPLWIELFYSGL